MYVETYNNNNKSARLGRCGVTVLDIVLRVVCNDKDGCVSRLEAVGSDYRGFSFQRFPGTVSEGYGMLSKSVEARKGRIASPEQRGFVLLARSATSSWSNPIAAGEPHCLYIA